MLFTRLIEENSEIWEAYLEHDFVKSLENGSLPRENFLFYLKQDYIYLINYAKCYARLALNATNARELRFAMRFQNYIVDGELALHQEILALGIDADELKPQNESLTNIAYTRYMLGVGDSGDFLDMLIALSACAIGYGYIGARILGRLGEVATHPYKAWIDTYSGAEFQVQIKDFEDFVNSYTTQISEAKFKRLSEIFAAVVRLEITFWQHGLTMKMGF